MSHPYKTFNQQPVNAMAQPMFFGENVNVARYDQQRYEMFENLTVKQLSFFWRPEEVDISRDGRDFASLPKSEQHIFLSNLKYQTLLDSVQGRSPNVAFLPLVSIPELETWIETWAFSETIHSRSYTHIMRNVLPDPSAVLDSIVSDEQIRQRAMDVTRYYDNLIELTSLYQSLGEGEHVVNGKTVVVSLRALKRAFYLALVAVNVLESVRFYVSFACTFAFAERELMEGNAKIVKLIARDENLHKVGTQYMLRIIAEGKDDPELADIARECQAELLEIFDAAVKQEKDWARHLFQYGSMMGLNEAITCQYIEFVANTSLLSIGLPVRYDTKENPIPWINHWLVSDNVQVAPQETEISSYLVGQVDSTIEDGDFADIDL